MSDVVAVRLTRALLQLVVKSAAWHFAIRPHALARSSKGQFVRIAGRWISNQVVTGLCSTLLASQIGAHAVSAGAGISGGPGTIGANRSSFHYGLVSHRRPVLLVIASQTFAFSH